MKGYISLGSFNASVRYACTRFLLCWMLLIGMIIPAALYAGYSLVSLENIVIVILCGIFAIVLMGFSRFHCGVAIMVVTTLSLDCDLYYAMSLSTHYYIAIGCVVGIVSIAVLAWYDNIASLAIASILVGSQVFSAGVAASPTSFTLERHVNLTNAPSVVHLLLDEHAAIDSVPADIISADERRALIVGWEKLGFRVFRHAYSVDPMTHMTVSRIWNNSEVEPEQAIEYGKPPQDFNLKSFVMANIVTANRALDITVPSYISATNLFNLLNSTSRYSQIEYPRYTGGLEKVNLALSDRLVIMGSRIADWFYRSSRSNVVKYWGDYTDYLNPNGGLLWGWRSTFGITSRDVLVDFVDRLICCAQRGTYYYLHLLLPHYPYMFDRSCSVRPVRQWLYNTVPGSHELNTLKTRRARYLLYFEQLICTQIMISDFLDKLKSIPKMSDAIVVVHGDHGSRISLTNSDRLALSSPSDYTEGRQALDQRATFLAIKAPTILPGEEFRPARLDWIIHELWKTDFTNFEDAFSIRRQRFSSDNLWGEDQPH
jgi:hypothetical protein